MRPSPLLFYSSIVLLFSSMLSVIWPAYHDYWYIPAILAGIPALIDALLMAFFKVPVMRRELAPVLAIGTRNTVRLVFEAATPFVRSLEIFDGIPASFHADQLPLRIRPLRMECRSGFSVCYDVIPSERGNFEFTPAHVERPSPLGFWLRRYRLGASEKVRVYPDYRKFSAGGFHLGGTPSPSREGHNLRRRGLGLEFHQLREYREGDMMRMVDGKASSRFNKLIVREMQEEEDQIVMFLLDTGYRMTAVENGIRHFDQAFDAMLSLAWVALRQGDKVGVYAWGPDERWIPPMRSVASFPALVHRLYDIQAHPEASSPAIALSRIMPRLTRRTLIILLSNFREGDGEGIPPLIPMIRERHLLCTVWMREAISAELARRIPSSHEEALETSMARFYLTEREVCRRSWEAEGILTIDTEPENLRSNLLQHYWDIKKRGIL